MSYPETQPDPPLGKIDHVEEKNGYILDATQVDSAEGLKTSRDGHNILIPQPSEDPNDPLNWSQTKKHVMLMVISATAFLPDYGAATGAVTLIPQAKEWNMNPDTINHATVGNVFMVGAGGVIVVALAAYFGRLPVFFWFTLFAFVTAAWCAGATSFESFMAARILNGFISTVAQGGGLMLIEDMFFFHEHARKINIWSAFITVSPYMGPLIAAFIITKLNWTWPFWIFTIETGLCLIGIILFLDETYYDRRIPLDKQPARRSKVLRLIGVEQFRSRHLRNSFWQAMIRPAKAIVKPTVFISCAYFLFTFAWTVGINTTLSIIIAPLYDFGPKQIGFLQFAPVTAAILGEVIGHYLHDALATLYMRRHHGRLDPEARLLACYVATPFMLSGLVLIGFAMQHTYHYMLIALGWGLYVFGTMIVSVALNAYNLDSYPEASGEVAAWVNFSRTTGGFIVGFFQVRWVTAMGPQRMFGVQAGVTAGVLPLVIGLSLWGKRVREWSGGLSFKTV
ncbi:MAG: hypothetical protein OHK93_007966 [Ramalina farinacea]|uniref:Major facilitator superfamily (MFS) profile domain-containing protein n=1 Tax=Ramalina farinacea TaxID=258253 RepID=A0AA43QQT5_9LECA|nr:hypothetical protein [Ramalina farinacea]